MLPKRVKVVNGRPGVTYREIVGFAGYAVGDDGSVWTRWARVGKGAGANGGRYSGKTCGWTWQLGPTWKERKLSVSSSGYLVVGLGSRGNRKTFYVQDLVLLAFVGPRPRGQQACHYPDRTKTNCCLANLRWGTPVENRQDSIEHGTQVRGSTTGTAVLTEKKVQRIIRRLDCGDSIAAISRDYAVGETTIRNIKQNRTWQHIPRG